MGGCGPETGEVEEGTSADRDDVGVSADFEKLDRLPDFLDEGPAVFTRFAALDDDRVSHESEGVGVRGEVAGDPPRQGGIGFGHTGVEQNEDFRITVESAGVGDEIAQGVVLRVEGAVGEGDPVLEVNGNGTLNHRELGNIALNGNKGKETCMRGGSGASAEEPRPRLTPGALRSGTRSCDSILRRV